MRRIVRHARSREVFLTDAGDRDTVGGEADVLDLLLERATGDRHLYRGRVVRAGFKGGELTFEPIETTPTTRDDLVVDPTVWGEIDLNISAVDGRADVMRRLGFPTRRGILLAGPPGVGKTAIDRVIVNELQGRFTVILVGSVVGSYGLMQIYDETRNLGPTVVVLEDIDLFVGRRGGQNDHSLSALLAALDGTSSCDGVLTIATTNDPEALDSAAIRSARFDAIIEINYPTRAAATQILRRYVATLPRAEDIDTAAIARALPDDVSGADLREVVRRTVLAAGPDCGTSDFIAAIASGRWRAAPLTGSYL